MALPCEMHKAWVVDMGAARLPLRVRLACVGLAMVGVGVVVAATGMQDRVPMLMVLPVALLALLMTMVFVAFTRPPGAIGGVAGMLVMCICLLAMMFTNAGEWLVMVSGFFLYLPLIPMPVCVYFAVFFVVMLTLQARLPPRRMLSALEEARAAKGLCLTCGYDRSTLPREMVCPECGAMAEQLEVGDRVHPR